MRRTAFHVSAAPSFDHSSVPRMPKARSVTPEPTTTASCSANDAPELVVGDETALLRAEPLDRREHLSTPRLRHVEAELVCLDADRVEAALLAEDDRALGRHELRRVRLDRRRVVELAGHGAGLAPVEGVPGDRLPRLELVPRELADALGDGADAVETQVGVDAI